MILLLRKCLASFYFQGCCVAKNYAAADMLVCVISK